MTGDVNVGAAKLQPIEVAHDFFDGVPQRPAFFYGIFNPMGPTWNLITIVEGRRHVRERGYLVCHRMLNPFASSNTLWAAIPIETPDEGIVASIARLFGANGDDAHPLVGSMPTWIKPAIQGNGLGQAAEPAMRAFAATHPSDLRWSTSEFRKYLGRPWDRLTAQQDATMEFLRAHPLSGPDPFESNAPPENGDGRAGDFDDWLQVMFDPRHSEPEMAVSLQAWDLAIQFQIDAQGGEAQTRAIFPDLMTSDELAEALGLAGF